MRPNLPLANPEEVSDRLLLHVTAVVHDLVDAETLRLRRSYLLRWLARVGRSRPGRAEGARPKRAHLDARTRSLRSFCNVR